MEVKLLITDFDGTLVDTFEANYQAYRDAFNSVGRELMREEYKRCFGLRFDRFMDVQKIYDTDERAHIRETKANVYPRYFNFLKVNKSLINLFSTFHRAGGLTAVASTARAKNLQNVLGYIGINDIFDLILAGESVTQGKPNPEIYHTVLSKLDCKSEEALIFEDSEVGFAAAEAAGIKYIAIKPEYFNNED